MRRACAVVIAAASLAACSNPLDERATQQRRRTRAAGGETASPKDAPTQYKVLADDVNKQTNTVDYHVLVARRSPSTTRPTRSSSISIATS